MIDQLEKIEGLQIIAPSLSKPAELLTEEALEFIAALHRKFNNRRKQLLEDRLEVQRSIDNGSVFTYLKETENIRNSEWKVNPIPEDLQDRRTEITGPVDRKMVINALNSGAKVFMADFEDANSPTWDNCLNGQLNLFDAIRKQIDFNAPNGKEYKLNDKVAVLKVRPRGWHLNEKHVKIDGEEVSASLFDFGLYFFHNAKELLARGSGPYFYLPKLESHLEAKLWNDVFVMAQNYLDIPQGTIKVTVLIETISAAFEMEEIIYVLKEHMAGLNAGRWDYIFSIIKKFKTNPDFIMPDRGQVTMTTPFMSAYAEQLVKACHKRGAHAIGGMSAFIPAKNEEVNKQAFKKVKQDKKREASIGYDGTWVAHPLLVEVAMEEFNKKLTDGKVNQKDDLRESVEFNSEKLLQIEVDGGKITEAGFRNNINVAILYIESWLSGTGAAALYNLMEDAATAEISRAQIWQWLHSGNLQFSNGNPIDFQIYEHFLAEEKVIIEKMLGPERVETGNLNKAIRIFDKLIKTTEFLPFLTLLAYEHLD
ncbi:malate synthase A [Marinigracilibium pacificum]|uniref:Malate synthase n=1 Tax=Marinigracilibium pacificum TaxID=2729599 RepID=A0A848J7U8_9BACT|nr:malate synthase A [Marinigracilibium pacificum]NMM49172.1 malate synthase A [Marinigracilibium pacificum]